MALVKRRPNIPPEQDALNRKEIRRLREVGASAGEIRSTLSLSSETLYRLYHEEMTSPSFGYLPAVRRRQIELALAGNYPLLKRLGIKYCGQGTKQRQKDRKMEEESFNREKPRGQPPKLIIVDQDGNEISPS